VIRLVTDPGRPTDHASGNADSRRRRQLLFVVHLAGLIGTGLIIWYTSVGPRLRRLPPATIIADALKYAALAWVWSAGLTFALCAAASRWDGVGAMRMALRTSRTAVWFAPASLLLSQTSPTAVIPALALVIGTTHLLYAQWIAIYPNGPAPALKHIPFGPLPSAFLVGRLAPALGASLCAQGALAAVLMSYPIIAAALFCAAAAMATLCLLVGGLMQADRADSLPRAAFGALLTLILAAGLTTVHGLYHSMAGGIGENAGTGTSRNPLDSVRALIEKLMERGSGDDDSADLPPRLYEGSETNIEISDKVFPGVVLWPEVKPYTILVPPAPSWTRNSLSSVAAAPFTIPFGGQYWMFKPPHVRPPPGHYFQRGSPLELSYVTTDHSRMLVEARQRLDRPIPLSCCVKMRMAIANADRHTGTVALELFLVNSRAPGAPSESVSLGTNDVTQWPDVKPRQKSFAPVFEVLEFSFPRKASFEEFHEIRIVFHRDPVRYEKSAKISIERFTLVPRTI
jgi:hypothetical protein